MAGGCDECGGGRERERSPERFGGRQFKVKRKYWVGRSRRIGNLFEGTLTIYTYRDRNDKRPVY